MNEKRLFAGFLIVLGASGLGVGLWTALAYAVMGTVIPLQMDVALVRAALWALVVVALLGAVTFALMRWPVVSEVFTPTSRLVVLGLVLLGALAWGGGVLSDAMVEHEDQALPDQALRLIAAYPYDVTDPDGDGPRMASVVVDEAGAIGDVIELGGRRWNVHESDAFALEDVERIRWYDRAGTVAVTLRVGGETRWNLDERMRHRASQYDVLTVDGEPVAPVFYAGFEPGRIVLMDEDPVRLHRVYRRLTTR